MVRIGLFAAGLTACFAVACGARSGLGLVDGEPTGAGGGSGAGAPSGVVSTSSGTSTASGLPAHGCEGLPGPAMVHVSTKSGASYCIDSTEVTNADYAVFIASSPSLEGQPAECAFNHSYLPHPNIPAPWPQAGREQYPIQWVDWCDARAYCAFAGKRLCGHVGGGFIARDDLDPAHSEWMNACTHQGDSHYPYGPGLVEGACNVGSLKLDDLSAPVSSFVKCEGGFPGMFDMVGNVSEFVDDCEAGTCEAMGPSFFNSGDACGAAGVVTSIVSGGSILGVRCCKNAD